MKILKSFDSDSLVREIKSGMLAVIPTDTIYGIVAEATNKKSVREIYDVKNRAPKKPFIILIADISDLKKFNVTIPQSTDLSDYWPGPNSIILGCDDEKFNYLSRGTRSLAFRLPSDDSLIKLLQQTGPLVAPSANPEGKMPARDIKDAIDYFGEKIEYYVDSGRLTNPPSSLFDLTGNSPIKLR